jgi:hypothetical protein
MFRTFNPGVFALNDFRVMIRNFFVTLLNQVFLLRIWARKDFHYDNCFYAMLTLFAVQTSEGWVA